MLVFLTPLIGGYLADRFIGTRRSLVIGGLIIASGHFCLAVNSMTMFYVGLTLIIIGTGFFKPNVSTMVGQIYADGDTRRDAGFTIFYIGINTGAFLGGLVAGISRIRRASAIADGTGALAQREWGCCSASSCTLPFETNISPASACERQRLFRQSRRRWFRPIARL
jgi:Dipeptide/tripeptide permease